MNFKTLVSNVFSSAVQRAVGFASILISLRLVQDSYPRGIADFYIQLSTILIVFQFLDFGIGNAFVNEYSALSNKLKSGSLLARYFYLTLSLSFIGATFSVILIFMQGGVDLLLFPILLWMGIGLSLVPKYFIATNRSHISNIVYTGIPLVSLLTVACCSYYQLPPMFLYASGPFAILLCFGIAMAMVPELIIGLRLSFDKSIDCHAAIKIFKQASIWVIYQAAMFVGINSDYIIGRNIFGLSEDMAVGGVLRIAYGLTLVSMVSVPIWPWIARSFILDTYPVLRRKIYVALFAFFVSSLSVGLLSYFIFYFGSEWIVGKDSVIGGIDLLIISIFVFSYNLWFGISSLITSKDLLPITVMGCLVIFFVATLFKLSMYSSANYISLILTTSLMLMAWNLFGLIRLRLALARKRMCVDLS